MLCSVLLACLKTSQHKRFWYEGLLYTRPLHRRDRSHPISRYSERRAAMSAREVALRLLRSQVQLVLATANRAAVPSTHLMAYAHRRV